MKTPLSTLYKPGCPFCKIVHDEAPGDVVIDCPRVLALRPLNPVTRGHLLFIPKTHVENAAHSPEEAAEVMKRAAAYAMERLKNASEDSNLITSNGTLATQTVFHLHIHYVPRRVGDGLWLPWTAQKMERRG